ncbi:gamma-glutamyltransferase [Pseudomonas huanghezhanensis]|uniref:gamma-glutamyltransferase n=1 Tax=Pseudomonas huanghezhanensis TaxID=3002903 RepID=UPI002285BBC2|nr:gamma-glutamyltransferase [Pseudomonas sp. BSw22131]
MTLNLQQTPFLVGAWLLTFALSSAQATPDHPDTASIATAHPQATAAGREVMIAGGNAFDAAIAISAVLGVVEPYASGLGGGGFFLLRQAGEPTQYQFLDAREKAPLKATSALYLRHGIVQPDLSLNGPLAAAIPGIPAALVELAEHYGRLPLTVSLAPAIRIAHQGFAVDEIYRERASWRLFALRNNKESARLFLRNNNVPALGDIIQQPELAATLDRLADRGRAGFYNGLTAQAMVEGVRDGGGVWSFHDFEQYEVVTRQPLRFLMADKRELITAPPPSAGGVTLAQSLFMLQQLPWRESGKVDRAHYVIEVLRRAYRDRGLFGDPDFVPNPIAQVMAPNYLMQHVTRIDPRMATPNEALPPAPRWREGDNTTHFAVLDSEGNAVAATLSVNLPFGSAFTVPGTGVLLNDQMDDFAIDPGRGTQNSKRPELVSSPPNSLLPGKRPLSSMSPSFIESPQAFAAFGTTGGSRVPSAVLLSMLQYLDEQPVVNWTATARYHHQYLPNVVDYEPGAFTSDELADLQARGYRLNEMKQPYGDQQVLFWNKNNASTQAASDPRGIGVSMVFRPDTPLRQVKTCADHSCLP